MRGHCSQIHALLIVFACAGFLDVESHAQTTFRMFGHLEALAEQDGDAHFSGFSVGEHDFFVTSELTDRISFLSETTIWPQGGQGGFGASIERVRIAFSYADNHSIIVGKMHTPVNLWNDRFHHGRYFVSIH